MCKIAFVNMTAPTESNAYKECLTFIQQTNIER